MVLVPREGGARAPDAPPRSATADAVLVVKVLQSSTEHTPIHIYTKKRHIALSRYIYLNLSDIATIKNSPAAHGGRPLPMGWVY